VYAVDDEETIGCRWVVLRSKLKGRFENATIGG